MDGHSEHVVSLALPACCTRIPSAAVGCGPVRMLDDTKQRDRNRQRRRPASIQPLPCLLNVNVNMRAVHRPYTGNVFKRYKFVSLHNIKNRGFCCAGPVVVISGRSGGRDWDCHHLHATKMRRAPLTQPAAPSHRSEQNIRNI